MGITVPTELDVVLRIIFPFIPELFIISYLNLSGYLCYIDLPIGSTAPVSDLHNNYSPSQFVEFLFNTTITACFQSTASSSARASCLSSASETCGAAGAGAGAGSARLLPNPPILLKPRHRIIVGPLWAKLS